MEPQSIAIIRPPTPKCGMFDFIPLEHSADSSYEPDRYNKFQLAARKEDIDKLTRIIGVSNTRLSLCMVPLILLQMLPEPQMDLFFQLQTLVLLCPLQRTDLALDRVQKFLGRDATSRYADLCQLHNDCARDPGQKRLLWYTPVVCGWMLRQILPSERSPTCPHSKDDVNFVLLRKLWPRGRSATFREIWGCLPETIGLKASNHIPLEDLTSLAIIVKDTPLFKHKSVDVENVLEQFFYRIPQLPPLLQLWCKV
jgi:hypothetical protein